MAGLTKGASQGFGRVLTGSLVLHIIVITLALLFFNAPKRKIFTPVYTVDLVANGPKAKAAAPAKKAAPAPAPAPAEEPKAAPPVVEPAPPKAEQPKPAAAKKPEQAKPPVKKEAARETVKIKPRDEEKISVSGKIEEIAKKKEMERQEALLSSSIEEIKKKQQEQSREVSERLEDIKKRLAAGETKAAPAQPAAQAKAPAPAAGQASGGSRIGFAGRSGVTSENLQTQYREYYNIIHDRIHDQWIYPAGFEYESVTVIVSIRIDRSGNLIKSWLEESSGNRSFDDSLINATRKAAPFPPLPVDLEGNFLDVGLRFCPKCPE